MTLRPPIGLVVLLLAAPGAPAQPRLRKPARTSPKSPTLGPSVTPGLGTGPGEVTSVTADSVFLNRGKADGVVVGATLPVLRGSKPIGSCTVTAVSDHGSACTGQSFRVGDRVAKERQPKAPPAPLVELPGAEVMLQRRTVVKQAPFVLVEREEGAGLNSTLGGAARLVLGQEVYTDFGSSRGGYVLERLDASLADLALPGNLSLSADGSLLVWARRPNGFENPRTSVVQLSVRQLQLAWKPGALVVRGGRVRLRYTPGLTSLDGAQLGFQLGRGETELGVFGGLLSDMLTTAPSLSGWAVGGYGMSRWTSPEGGAEGWLVQAEGRAGYSMRPGSSARFEGGVVLRSWVARTFDAQLLAVAGSGSASSPASLDTVSADLGVQLADRFRLRADARYRGAEYQEAVPLGSPLPATRSAHASLDVSYELLRWLTVTLQGGSALELGTGNNQVWYGPELSLPALGGGRLGLAAGYQEELGWLRGRSAYLTGTWTPRKNLRFSARGSWYSQLIAEPLGHNDFGAWLGVEVRVTAWLIIRASGLWRTAAPVSSLSNPLASSLLQASLQVGVDF